MAMSWVWTGMVVIAFFYGVYNGTLDVVAAAALNGAQSALELSLSMAGILCLWSGVMEILNVCGLSRRIAILFRPLLRRLLPNASRDEETLAAVSANVSANLLGLGNAATPLGIQAAGQGGIDIDTASGTAGGGSRQQQRDDKVGGIHTGPPFQWERR